LIQLSQVEYLIDIQVFPSFCQKEETRKNREHAPTIVRPANTPPLGVANLRSRFDNGLFFSNRFELALARHNESGVFCCF
jgi:hypothetical protein